MSFNPRPLHVPHDGGESVFLVGDTYTVLLTGEQTDGQLSVVEASVPALGGPPPHVHHRETETFVVVDGHLEVRVGEEEYEVSPGGLVHVPKGVSHQFRNTSHEKPAKMLALFNPAGMEGMFTEIGTPGVRGQLAPPRSAEDVAAMERAGTTYGLTFD